MSNNISQNRLFQLFSTKLYKTSIFKTIFYLAAAGTLILYLIYIPDTFQSKTIYKLTDSTFTLLIIVGTFLFYKNRINLATAANILAFSVMTNLYLECIYNSIYNDNVEQWFIYAMMSTLIHITIIAVCSNVLSLIVAMVYFVSFIIYFNVKGEISFQTIPFITILLMMLTYSILIKFFFSTLHKEYLREIRINKISAYNRGNKLDTVKTELQDLQKEIKSKSLDMSKLTSQNNQLVEELERMKELETNRQHKDEIIQMLNQYKIVENNTLWTEFELRFKHIQDDFYKKLNTQFPNLSPAEQNLCAFLKLGLSTKQIALLTSTTAASIEVNRSRLRKKLELSSKDNLKSFFLNY